MDKIYIQAKSRKVINAMLDDGIEVIGTEYNVFNPNGYMIEHKLSDCPTGTLIAIFQKYVGGQPYTRWWARWNKEKNQVLTS